MFSGASGTSLLPRPAFQLQFPASKRQGLTLEIRVRTGNLTPAPTWTSDQEARLAYCQDQLKQAQKKWSDRQELWIREVIT